MTYAEHVAAEVAKRITLHSYDSEEDRKKKIADALTKELQSVEPIAKLADDVRERLRLGIALQMSDDDWAKHVKVELAAFTTRPTDQRGEKYGVSPFGELVQREIKAAVADRIKAEVAQMVGAQSFSDLLTKIVAEQGPAIWNAMLVQAIQSVVYQAAAQMQVPR